MALPQCDPGISLCFLNLRFRLALESCFSRTLGFDFYLCRLLAWWPWASCWTSLCLNFLIHKMGIMTVINLIGSYNDHITHTCHFIYIYGHETHSRHTHRLVLDISDGANDYRLNWYLRLHHPVGGLVRIKCNTFNRAQREHSIHGNWHDCYHLSL